MDTDCVLCEVQTEFLCTVYVAISLRGGLSLTLVVEFGFDPGLVHVRVVVGKVALGRVLCEFFGYSLLASFHRFSILFILMLLL
jgi:hypothetical protein